MAKSNEILIYIRDKVNLSGLKTVQARLGKVRQSVRNAFNSAPVRAFRLAVLGVGAALAASVVEGAKFNIQMARVWTMAGGGGQNFRELRSEARGLAADFGKARSEIASGMYSALSAGIDRSNLESFMRSAAQVAVADGSDISTAVDGITTVLNAFGIEATRTEEVTDQLFQTVKLGKTTFGELSSSLSNVASTAAASNIPLKQILAHIAALTAQGTPTSQATTQIRQSIIGLNKTLGDGWSATMSYQQALKAVWAESGQSQTRLLELVGSTEAMQAVLGGVGKKAHLAAEKLAGMTAAAGAAKEAFDKVDQFRHWPKAIESARGFLSKLGEEINERIAPFVDSVTEKIKEWTDSESLWEKIRAVMDAATDRIQAAGEATREIVDQINSISDLKTVFEGIGNFLVERSVFAASRAMEKMIERAPEVGTQITKGLIGFVTPDPVEREAERIASNKVWGSDNPTWAQSMNLLKAIPFFRETKKAQKGLTAEGVLTTESERRVQKVKLEERQLLSVNEHIDIAWKKRDDAMQVAYEKEKATAIAEVIDMASSGKGIEAINDIIDTWELNAEEYAELGAALDAAADAGSEANKAAAETTAAAVEMQQATAKSLEATTASHVALQSSLDASTLVAQQTTVAAEKQAGLIADVLAVNAKLIAVQREQQQSIAVLQFEVQNIKV